MAEYIIELENDLWIDTFARRELRGEVIRCKDCEYCYEDDTYWRCRKLGIIVAFVDGREPIGFCCWASRKN